MAYMTSYAPAKARDFWKLKSLLHDAPKKGRQSVAEQIAIAHQWTAALSQRR